MKLAPVFADGMILQQDQPIRIYGRGSGTLKAVFLDETVTLETDGPFCAEFRPRTAGGPYEMTLDMDGEVTVLHDILIGQVFMVAGQSNAELTLAQTSDADTPFAADPLVRMYMPVVPTLDGKGGVIDVESPYAEKWTALTQENARDWSAIALFTALHYREKYHVPVGITCCYKGASGIQTFMSPEAYARHVMDPVRMHDDLRIYLWNDPSTLYEKFARDLVPYRVSGVIWYQGESNRTVYEAGFYPGLLASMIDEWRHFQHDPALPFAVVQINDFPEPSEEGVTAIQKAQEKACAAIDRCTLVVIRDLGEHELIHPTNKRECARRACAALDEMLDA